MFYRSRHRSASILVLFLYALLGLGGLAHYALAPPSMHTLAMNATIVVEVITAIALLVVLTRLSFLLRIS